MKYRLVDLASDHWRRQPRDHRGRWTDSPVRRLVAKALVRRGVLDEPGEASSRFGKGSPEHRAAQQRARAFLREQAARSKPLQPDEFKGKRAREQRRHRIATGWASGRRIERNSDEHKAYIAQIEKILTDPSNDRYDTQKTYSVRIGGVPVYRRERQRLHDEIISEILAKTTAKAERKAVMSGGLGGSGKGTTIAKGGLLARPGDYLTLDPDGIKEIMVEKGMTPDVPGLQPLETAKYIHEESGDIYDRLRDIAISRGLNVVVDRTMGSNSAIEEAKALKGTGYRVQAFFSDVHVETSVDRALLRHLNGANRYWAGLDKKGGRFVPLGYIRSAGTGAPAGKNSKNRDVFDRLVASGILDAARVYDNTVEGADPRLVSSVGTWQAE